MKTRDGSFLHNKDDGIANRMGIAKHFNDKKYFQMNVINATRVQTLFPCSSCCLCL